MRPVFVVLGNSIQVPTLAGGSKTYKRGDVFTLPSGKEMKEAPQVNREAILRMIQRFTIEKTPPVIREATEEEAQLVKVTLPNQADVNGTLERNLESANETILGLRQVIKELRAKITDLEQGANQVKIGEDQQRVLGVIESGVKEANRTVLEASVKAQQGADNLPDIMTEQTVTDGNQTEREAAIADTDTLPDDFPARDAYLSSEFNTLSKLRAAAPKDWRTVKGVTDKVAKDTESYLLKMVR